MSIKCVECGLVDWARATSCGRCGSTLEAHPLENFYSEARRGRWEGLRRHLRLGPFFKALLISIGVELVMLFFTLVGMGDGMMRHSALAPRDTGNQFLGLIGFIFHLPSILIATPLGLFLFFPLIQVALMTCVLGFIFRWNSMPIPR